MSPSILAGLGPLPRGLQAALGRPGDLTVRSIPAPFHIITYNVAFLPVGYLGREGNDCRDTIIAEILASGADVVGLTEGWAHADGIADGVKSLYPYRGHAPGVDLLGGEVPWPFAAGRALGAGIVLLSRHPFLAADERAYRDSAGSEGFVNKGISWVRIHPAGLPAPIDLFLTHTQAVYDHDVGAPEQAKQLAQLAAYVGEKRDPRNPAIVFGDLNFDGLDPRLYEPAMTLLEHPVDAWVSRTGNLDPGVTFSRSNDFDKDYDVARRVTLGPEREERLDYVLVYPGRTWTLCLDDVAVLRWRTARYDVSDHFGLRARGSHGLGYP